MPVVLTAGKDLLYARGSVFQVAAGNQKNLGKGEGVAFITIVPPRWGWKMFLPKDPATRNSHLFFTPRNPHLFFAPRTAIGPNSLFLGDSMKEHQQPCVNY